MYLDNLPTVSFYAFQIKIITPNEGFAVINLNQVQSIMYTVSYKKSLTEANTQTKKQNKTGSVEVEMLL